MHKKFTAYFLIGTMIFNGITIQAVETIDNIKIHTNSSQNSESQGTTEGGQVGESENADQGTTEGGQVGEGENADQGTTEGGQVGEGENADQGATEGGQVGEGENADQGTTEGGQVGEGENADQGTTEGGQVGEGENVDQDEVGDEQADGNESENQVTAGDENKAIFVLGSKEVLLFGEQVTLAIAPQVIDGRTLLPLRFIGEELLEAYVGYNASTKQITVRKDDLNVELVLGSKRAKVNGQEMILDVAPIIQNGTTLLPLRFMAETFELEIDYDSATKVIEVEKPISLPNTPPNATFTFNEESYTVGEVIEATVEAEDAEGHEIVAYRWMLDRKSSKVYPSLEALSKHLEPNLSAISLQVQDERGAWSEWYTDYIVIKPNSAPIIDKFETTKESYAQGEPIEFAFDYTNEDFEGIKGQKWTYRAKNEKLNQSILEKPKAIYDKGEYIVSLELQDDAGNWSTKKEILVTITDEVKESEFAHIFRNGEIGQIITNFGGTNFREYEDVENITKSDDAGTLVMSNSPEVVKTEGILYEEYIDNSGRVMFHHINDFNSLEKKKLVVMIENQGEEVVEGKIKNKVIKGPSNDVLFVGQQLLFEYLGAKDESAIKVEPGQTHVVYDSSSKNWFRKQAISGMFDYTFDGEVKITVVAMNANDPLESIQQLGYPQRDIHPRGTFDVINQKMTVDLSEQKGPSKMIIGSGEEEWLVGEDGITGEVVMNKGNFGMTYEITITADEDTAVILNPRGNMYKGAIKWNGMEPFLTPKSGFFPDAKRAAFLGVVKAGFTRTFTYMLPNGSSAPVLIGFIPESDWNE